jgi:thioredoxin 1
VLEAGRRAAYIQPNRILPEHKIMATKTVTDASFEADVLSADGPVLVDFWAEWCTPCKAIAPALEQISDELGGKVTIAKLDIDENPDTAGKYGVMSIPTMILFKGGERAATKIGAAPKSQLQNWLEGELADSGPNASTAA